MRTVLKTFYHFIKDFVHFILFVLRLLYQGKLNNPIKKVEKGTITLLANGPSLKNIVPLLTTDECFKHTDFIVLNYFPNEKVFWKLKPKYYCLADPMFFGVSHKEKEVKNLFKNLNNIDWNISLFIPKYFGKERFLNFSQMNNPNIEIVEINSIPYNGFPQLRNYLYKKGFTMPQIGTVAHLAIYASLNLGYKEIKLYGVEHTFLDSLCVNEQNQLCNKDKHFYDNEDVKLKPILKNDSINEIWKISDYLYGISLMFKGHDLLSDYANYLDVRIINCTKDSMIDSYERISNNI